MSVPAADSVQYRSARQQAAWVDLSARAQLRVVGPDRVSFVQGMVTNDVEGLAEGAALYAAMLTAKGAMVGDVRVLKRPDELVLDTGAGQGATVRDFLNKYLISEEAEVLEAPQLAVVGLLGPEAAAALQAIDPALRLAELPGLLGSGRDVLVPREALSAVRQALAPWPELSADTFEVLRVEAGVPRYGVDMTDTTIPLEANLHHAIHLAKGCYIGQEVIARATHRGHMNRTLAGLLLGHLEPAPGTELQLDGKKVGWLTSVVQSVKRGQVVALGYLAVSVKPGATVQLASGGSAEACPLPF